MGLVGLVDSRLARHRVGLVSALAVVVTGASLLVLVCLLRLILASAVEASPDLPGLDGRDARFPDPAYRAAESGDSGTPDGDRKQRVPLPAVDWNDVALRRRGMSLLLLDGDCRSARRLLRAVDPDRKELLRLTESRNRSAVEALARALPGGAAGSGPAEMPLADRLRRAGESLSDESLFRFVVNLHCELREQTGASDAHLKLLLESCFPPGSPARSIYVNSQRLNPLPPASPPRETRE